MDRLAIGRVAEGLAAAYLEERGFTVLWKNVRIGSLEVDLVVQKDDLVVIVEVRSRGASALEGPLASIGWKKRRMLLRAARGIWRGRLKKRAEVARVRIDVIAVRGDEIAWVKGALTDDRS